MAGPAPDRRSFLRSALGVGLAGAGMAVAGVAREAGAAEGLPGAGAGRRGGSGAGTIVVVSLIGGLDGLSVLVPHGESEYARRRPTIAIGRPGERHGAIELDRGWGLHPALAPLHNTAGREERLAIIGGVGVPDRVAGARSHIASRRFMAQGGRDGDEGWAGRLLRFEGLGAESAWSFGPGPHPIFRGLDGAVAARRPAVSIGDHVDPSGAGTAIATAYGGTAVIERAGTSALAASNRWSGVEWTSAEGREELGYPPGRFGRALASTADLIRADRGLRVVAIDDDGYDTHVDQGDSQEGHLAHRLYRLAQGLAAFWTDVGAGRQGLVVAVVSEFGRTIDENSAGGTEHGRGGVALVVGEDVVGGIHGDRPVFDDSVEVWPATVDVRRVLADAAWTAGLQPWRGGIFPGLVLPNRSLGLLLSP